MSSNKFVQMRNFPNYEISTEYPYTIRKKKSGKIMKISTNSSGYKQVCLDGKLRCLHKIIAEQFIPNPNKYNEVDHISRIKSDNRIENLRWCTHKENCLNRGPKVNYVQKLPDDYIDVDTYNKYTFDSIYYSQKTNDLYVFNGLNYIILPQYLKGVNSYYVCATDTNNKRRAIYLNKLKKQYDLI